MKDAAFEAVLDEMRRKHEEGADVYGTPDDPVANLREAGDCGVPAWIAAQLEINKKTFVIQKAVRLQMTTGSTGMMPAVLEDRLMGRAVYSALALMLFREQMG